jgi:hypothetical protein
VARLIDEGLLVRDSRGFLAAVARAPAPAPAGGAARPRDTADPRPSAPANAPLLAPAPLPAPPPLPLSAPLRARTGVPAPVGVPPWGAGWLVSPFDGSPTPDFASHEASRAEAEARRRELEATAEDAHAAWLDAPLVAVVVAAATEDVSALDAAAGEAGRRLARQIQGCCGCSACRRCGAFVGLPPTWAPPPPGALLTRLAVAADLAASHWPNPRLHALARRLWHQAGASALAVLREREDRALSEARSVARSLAARYSS